MFKVNLPARKKNGIIIGIANSLVLIFVVLLYILSYYFSGVNQIKEKLLNEAKEIVTTHIIYKEQRIQFQDEENTDTIQNDLLTDGLSAIIFNQEGEIIGRFGIFDFNEELLKDDESVNNIVQNTLESNESSYSSEIDLYGGNSYESLAYPLQAEDKTFGVLLLYAPINYLQSLFKISFYILALVLPLSILINLAVGQIISNYAYNPIKKLIEKINNTNIHNINDKVTPQGNPKDESYQLAVNYNDMLDRVNEGVEKQKQFISNASHELKTPIARAISTLDVVKLKLRKKASQENTIDEIDSVRNELIELGSLINDLLVLSRVKENKGIDMIFNPKDELLLIKKKFNKDSIEAEISSSNILFNIGYFRSLFNNIIENAVKYGKPGSIKITGKDINNRFEISISNKVKGDFEADYEKMFKRFSTNSKNGFGLGLSIVKGIVEQENLELETQMKGKTFTITIKGFKVVNKITN